MARDSSGDYSLPAGNPVTSGAVISSTTHNSTLSDIAGELTDSLSRSGKGGMTAALKVSDGTMALPGLSFSSEPSTGLYRSGADDTRFSITNEDIWGVVPSHFKVFGTNPSIQLSSGATLRAQLIHTAATDLRLKSLEHGVPIYLAAEDAGGTERLVVGGDPDGGAMLYYAGVRSAVATSAGMDVNDSTSSTPTMNFRNSALTTLAAIQSSAALTLFRGTTSGAPISIQATDAGAVVRDIVRGDPDAEASLYYAGTARVSSAATGGTVVGALLDLNNSAAATATELWVRNSEGATVLRSDGDVFGIYQATSAGVVEDAWLVTANNGGVTLYWNNTATFRTASYNATDIGSGAEVLDFGGTWRPVGFLDMEALSITAARTIADDDMGKVIRLSTTPSAWTLDNDATIKIGLMFTAIAHDAAITLTQGSGVTLRWYDGSTSAGSTGNRTLAAGGIATVYKFSDTEYWCWGNGLS